MLRNNIDPFNFVVGFYASAADRQPPRTQHPFLVIRSKARAAGARGLLSGAPCAVASCKEAPRIAGARRCSQPPDVAGDARYAEVPSIHGAFPYSTTSQELLDSLTRLRISIIIHDYFQRLANVGAYNR